MIRRSRWAWLLHPPDQISAVQVSAALTMIAVRGFVLVVPPARPESYRYFPQWLQLAILATWAAVLWAEWRGDDAWRWRVAALAFIAAFVTAAVQCAGSFNAGGWVYYAMLAAIQARILWGLVIRRPSSILDKEAAKWISGN